MAGCLMTIRAIIHVSRTGDIVWLIIISQVAIYLKTFRILTFLKFEGNPSISKGVIEDNDISDHFPVYTQFRFVCGNKELSGAYGTDHNDSVQQEKFKWNNAFTETFDRLFTDELEVSLHMIIDYIHYDINLAIDKILDIYKKAGECMRVRNTEIQ